MWWRRLFVLLEIAVLYSLIQLYVWRWQFTHSGLAWPLFLLLLATHLWHRDTMWCLGFRFDNLIPALKLSALASLPFLVLLLIVGFVAGKMGNLKLYESLAASGLHYILWAIFQQYGLQGYFHHRLRQVIFNPTLSSAINALIFMSLHFPNPVLMVFTLLGGFALSLVYSRQPNIFALGIFHGLVGLLLANSFPRQLLHNMRVGPGYYR
jgi:membrane protease YdiL (CAAX protease family)